MAYVITSRCVSEVYAACQQVCPSDAIHFVAEIPAGYPNAGQPWMAIHPVDCTDCNKCLPACPIGAIVDAPAKDELWAQINANLAPVYRGQKATPRDRREPPRRPENKLVAS